MTASAGRATTGSSPPSSSGSARRSPGLYALVLRTRALTPAAATNRVLLFVLFYIVVVLILVLLFVLVRSAVRLVLEARRGVFGSRFRVRIVATNVGLALLPIVLLLLPTTGLLQRSVEQWFAPAVEETVRSGRRRRGDPPEAGRPASKRGRPTGSRPKLTGATGDAAVLALLSAARESSGVDLVEWRRVKAPAGSAPLAVSSPRWPVRDVKEPDAEWLADARARGAARRVERTEGGGQAARTSVRPADRPSSRRNVRTAGRGHRDPAPLGGHHGLRDALGRARLARRDPGPPLPSPRLSRPPRLRLGRPGPGAPGDAADRRTRRLGPPCRRRRLRRPRRGGGGRRDRRPLRRLQHDDGGASREPRQARPRERGARRVEPPPERRTPPGRHDPRPPRRRCRRLRRRRRGCSPSTRRPDASSARPARPRVSASRRSFPLPRSRRWLPSFAAPGATAGRARRRSCSPAGSSTRAWPASRSSPKSPRRGSSPSRTRRPSSAPSGPRPGRRPRERWRTRSRTR